MTGTVLNELKNKNKQKKILLNNSYFYQSIKVAVLQQNCMLEVSTNGVALKLFVLNLSKLLFD